MKSWKTTLAGLFAAGGTLLLTIEADWAKVWGPVIIAVGLDFGGISQRDNNVSSEDAGAK